MSDFYYFEDPKVKAIRKFRELNSEAIDKSGLIRKMFGRWVYEKTLFDGTTVRIDKGEYKRLEESHSPRIMLPFTQKTTNQLLQEAIHQELVLTRKARIGGDEPAFYANRGSLPWVGVGNGLSQVSFIQQGDYEVPLFLQPKETAQNGLNLNDIESAAYKFESEFESWLESVDAKDLFMSGSEKNLARAVWCSATKGLAKSLKQQLLNKAIGKGTTAG